MTKQITAAQFTEVADRLADECGESWRANLDAADLSGTNELTASLFRDNREEFTRRINQLVIALTSPHGAVIETLESQLGDTVEIAATEGGAPAVRTAVAVVDDVGEFKLFSDALFAGLTEAVAAFDSHGYAIQELVKGSGRDNSTESPEIFWGIVASHGTLAGAAIAKLGGDENAPAYWYALSKKAPRSSGLEALLAGLN